MLKIAREIMQAEAIKEAAQTVVKEWEEGIIIMKEGYGCGGLSISCLRDALGGYIPDEIVEKTTGDTAND